jgi:L-serine dehydratase
MESISVFDMLKIGIGPSSSHTLGPWRAAERFVQELRHSRHWHHIRGVRVQLYGSLALTGKGHGTDVALLLGLCGCDFVTIPVEEVHRLPARIEAERHLGLGGHKRIPFDPNTDIIFHFSERLPDHANGLVFQALGPRELLLHQAIYYSVGGSFVVKKEETAQEDPVDLPWPVEKGDDLLRHCRREGLRIADIVRDNERCWRSDAEIDTGLLRIWAVMQEAIHRGCHTDGHLPGGLQVSRRAHRVAKKLLCDIPSADVKEWVRLIRQCPANFSGILKLIGCFAMAVNEENAAFGRIVTAPTNGAAGVIPAVLMYYCCFSGKSVTDKDVVDFLLVAGVVGSIFKKGSTISAAMGGCQAEIGVSSAIAAAALTEGLGGSPEEALMAAEIAMEHHLGLTCDPVGGLVQVPYIEHNSMGAVKAITAANIALESDPDQAKVSLDDVVRTMWETARDMNSKYKEISQGGLAVNISIRIPEC